MSFASCSRGTRLPGSLNDADEPRGAKDLGIDRYIGIREVDSWRCLLALFEGICDLAAEVRFQRRRRIDVAMRSPLVNTEGEGVAGPDLIEGNSQSCSRQLHSDRWSPLRGRR